MADRAGFQIGRRFYPFPSRFRLGDPVLVEELTGVQWDEFLERLPDDDSPDDESLDPIAQLGLIGVAIWQENPTWRRDRVVRYTQALERDQIELVAPDVPEEELDEPAAPAAPGDGVDPPKESGGSNDSETSAAASGTGSGSPSEAATPETSGPSASDTGSQP